MLGSFSIYATNETELDCNITPSGGYHLSYDGPKVPDSMFYSIINQICDDPEEYLDDIADLAGNHIFSHLNECSLLECPFTRCCDDLRGDIEAKIIADVQTIYPDKQSRITLTSFGSGDFFQDLVVLARLMKAGYTQIHLNCIDKKWAQGHLESLQQERMSLLKAQVIELLRFLPSTVSLRLYSSGSDYIADCQRASANKSNIMYGIDYDDPQQSLSSISAYKWLVRNGLARNGRAYSATAESGELAVLVESASHRLSKHRRLSSI